mmetsp:Transcript_18776/g.27710  ORF Transcript_18776/g.27710 Transcript_18776/m.27710 type:complete len:215 (-) Transcript_18776:34-678(-)
MKYLSGLSPDELEFLAGDELVKISPVVKLKALHLRGDYGPFIPGIICSVPLWLALTLKKHKKANIICPPWMTVERLKETLRREKADEEFSKLPFRYIEISSCLLKVAGEDFGDDSEMIRSLLEDVENVRQGKTQKGMADVVKRQDTAIKVNGIGAMELLPVRTFLSASLGEMYGISGAKRTAEDSRDRASNRNVRVAPQVNNEPAQFKRVRRFR